MPRLEANGRFWEVVLDGTTVHTRSGSIGEDGSKTEPKEFPTREKAEQDIAKRVAGQKKRGFKVVSVELTEPSNAAMEQAIVDDPDEGRFLVYADWLQSQSHPRGELAVLQDMRAKNPGDAALEKSETKLFENNPGLAPPRVMEAKKAVTLRWENGFITAARLGSVQRPRYSIRELVMELLAHPAARFLRELRIGELGSGAYYSITHAAVVEEIIRARPRALRLLSIVDAPDPGYSNLGDLAGLPEAAPHLRELHLTTRAVKIGPIDFPKLQRLRLTCSSAEAVTSLAKAGLPALEELFLECGEAEIDSKTAAKLLDKSWRKLRRLALRRVGNADAIAAALAKSKVLAKLETLDLSGGRLSDDGGDALLASRSAFAHLTRLDVSQNLLGPSLVSRMKSVCQEVIAEPQRSTKTISISDVELEAFALEPAALSKGRALATPESWPALGREENTYWGHCQGSDLYEVYFRVPDFLSSCTCPSRQRPCKHSIGLAVLIARGHEFVDERVPPGLVSRADSSRRRYASSWE